MLPLEKARAYSEDLVESARKAGADAADAIYVGQESESVQVRLRELEQVDRSESEQVGLRVFVGQRSASVATSEFSDETMSELVSRALAMAQGGEVEQVGVGQLRGADIAHRPGDGLDPAGGFLLPLLQHQPDLATLQVLLAAAQVAGNDRELAPGRVLDDVRLAHVGQRPDHHVLAVVGQQLGRHARQPGVVEQVEEERGDHVVAVVAQRDLGEAVLGRIRVQRAAAHARA